MQLAEGIKYLDLVSLTIRAPQAVTVECRHRRQLTFGINDNDRAVVETVTQQIDHQETRSFAGAAWPKQDRVSFAFVNTIWAKTTRLFVVKASQVETTPHGH